MFFCIFIARYEEYGKAIEALNRLLDKIESNGTDQITVKDLKPLIKCNLTS